MLIKKEDCAFWRAGQCNGCTDKCRYSTTEKPTIMYCLECKTEEGTPHLPNCKTGKLPLQTADESFTQKEVEQGVAAMEEMLETKVKPDPETLGAVGQIADGDCYDEDTGDYLGQLTSTEIVLGTLPAQISIYFNGYWYIFKPQSRYKEEPEVQSKQGEG